MKGEIQEVYLEEVGILARCEDWLGFGHRESRRRTFQKRMLEPELGHDQAWVRCEEGTRDLVWPAWRAS